MRCGKQFYVLLLSENQGWIGKRNRSEVFFTKRAEPILETLYVYKEMLLLVA